MDSKIQESGTGERVCVSTASSQGWHKIWLILISGILILAPIGATILILIWVFTSIDNLLQPIVTALIGRNLLGIGFAVSLLLVIVVGFTAQNVLGKKTIEYLQNTIGRIPIVKPLYGTIRQIAEGFSGTTSTGFSEVVLVDFPSKGMKAIGFVTNKLVSKSDKKLLCVYIPGCPNPTAGFFQVICEDDIVRTDLCVSDAMKIVISAGKLSAGQIGANWEKAA